MKDTETKNRFIELRAQGWSYSRIAAELKTCKQTLINWSRDFSIEIDNMIGTKTPFQQMRWPVVSVRIVARLCPVFV